MKWIKGRQGGDYLKLKIWSIFNTDCYLIKYKAFAYINIHSMFNNNKERLVLSLGLILKK